MTSFQDFPILALGYSSVVAPIKLKKQFENLTDWEKWPIKCMFRSYAGYISF